MRAPLLACVLTLAPPAALALAPAAFDGGATRAPLASRGGAPPAAPCDTLAAAGTPCVAAYALTRALFAAYNEPLYQLRRAADGATLDVRPLAPGGAADAAAHAAFCAGAAGAACVVQRLYDQTARGNTLDVAPAGGHVHTADSPVNASDLRAALGGAQVFGALFGPGNGYRIENTTGVAKGDASETIYMVTSGLPEHVNSRCCFDFGNAEADAKDHGKGTMEALYFGTSTSARWSRGVGKGPWVMGDLENGIWAGNETPVNTRSQPLTAPFVFAMLKGDSGNHWALKGGDATAAPLMTMFDGTRPQGYAIMAKQGALILGIGGDNSDGAVGVFYEGAVTAGFSTDAADEAVFANVVAAGYALPSAATDVG